MEETSGGEEEMEKKWKKQQNEKIKQTKAPIIKISALKKEGIEKLEEEITKLFNESYEISCNNSSEDFNAQLEYEFILRLIKLAKNQNHDIYEALSIYFEKYNEFYLRKRKKDIVNISHEKQKENYI